MLSVGHRQSRSTLLSPHAATSCAALAAQSAAKEDQLLLPRFKRLLSSFYVNDHLDILTSAYEGGRVYCSTHSLHKNPCQWTALLANSALWQPGPDMLAQIPSFPVLCLRCCYATSPIPAISASLLALPLPLSSPTYPPSPCPTRAEHVILLVIKLVLNSLLVRVQAKIGIYLRKCHAGPGG